MSSASTPLPNWISYGLIPLINLLLAFFFSGLIIWWIGENPFEALKYLIQGSLGRGDAIGFTLFYTRSEEHTSELQSLMRISYAVFCLKKKKHKTKKDHSQSQ